MEINRFEKRAKNVSQSNNYGELDYDKDHHHSLNMTQYKEKQPSQLSSLIDQKQPSEYTQQDLKAAHKEMLVEENNKMRRIESENSPVKVKDD